MLADCGEPAGLFLSKMENLACVHMVDRLCMEAYFGTNPGHRCSGLCRLGGAGIEVRLCLDAMKRQ